MATHVVDLPAHNAWIEYPGVGTPSTQVGDHECLADGNDATGFSLSATTSGFYVGAVESVHTGYATSSQDALGFGLFDLPTGATLTDVRFVARLDVSSVGAVPGGSYASGSISPIPTRYPTLGVDYTGAPTTLGYALDAPNSGSGQVEVVGSDIRHLISGSDYVINGIGTPDTGTFGLCPLITIADPWWQFPREDHPVFVSYLAIRITYELVTLPPPRRRYPPVNNGGSGPTRHYPRTVNRRAGGTY